MMALIGMLSYNFQILLPLLASFTWHGTATTYALLTDLDGRRLGARRAGSPAPAGAWTPSCSSGRPRRSAC